LSTAIKFDSVGIPAKVLKTVKDVSSEQFGPDKIAMKFLMAPINPSDINMVEGTYKQKPALPAYGGNEGVAVVTKVGDSVADIRVGDWVVPSHFCLGVWRKEAIVKRDLVIKVPNDIPAVYAATLAVNPATAYRILRDFESLKPGDVIIQNGANSMVGLAVVQLAKQMGVRTINIIRSDRPEADRALRLLTNLGGDVNILDNYINTAGFKEIVAELGPIKLGFNCIGGASAEEIVRALAPGGTMVTFGGMSRMQTNLPLDLVASKQLKLKGFSINDWYLARKPEEKAAILSELSQLVREKKLTFFYELYDFDDFNTALKKSTETRPAVGLRKVVLNIDHPDRLAEHDARSEKDYDVFEAGVV
jgi:trans-2-enoyl-CoA reductase